MSDLVHAAVCYAISGFLIGSFVACMDEVNFHIRGHAMPWPRLWVFFVAGALWPAVLWKMVRGR